MTLSIRPCITNGLHNRDPQENLNSAYPGILLGNVQDLILVDAGLNPRICHFTSRIGDTHYNWIPSHLAADQFSIYGLAQKQSVGLKEHRSYEKRKHLRIHWLFQYN